MFNSIVPEIKNLKFRKMEPGKLYSNTGYVFIKVSFGNVIGVGPRGGLITSDASLVTDIRSPSPKSIGDETLKALERLEVLTKEQVRTHLEDERKKRWKRKVNFFKAEAVTLGFVIIEAEKLEFATPVEQTDAVEEALESYNKGAY